MKRFDDQSRATVQIFLAHYFPGENLDAGPALEATEGGLCQDCVSYVQERFGRAKYILGLAIDFTIMAQQLSFEDKGAVGPRPDFTMQDFEEQYKRVLVRGGTPANTLTVTYGEQSVGIRSIEEGVANLFHSLDRSSYPSAYVYNTGQWHKHTALLLKCFRLSERARLELCKRLIEFGLEAMPLNRFITRATPRPRTFPRIAELYVRSARGENGGLVFQALAYGFVVASHPHLSVVADKVRTGSSRQRRFGDIDCYYGLDLELSIEVKDLHINMSVLPHQLGQFMRKAVGQGVRGIAFVNSIEAEARNALAASRILAISHIEVCATIGHWDWVQQDRATQAMLHYLAHIEQNPKAVYRLLEFIQRVDPAHDSLAHRADYTEASTSDAGLEDEAGDGVATLDLD